MDASKSCYCCHSSNCRNVNHISPINSALNQLGLLARNNAVLFGLDGSGGPGHGKNEPEGKSSLVSEMQLCQIHEKPSSALDLSAISFDLPPQSDNCFRQSGAASGRRSTIAMGCPSSRLRHRRLFSKLKKQDTYLGSGSADDSNLLDSRSDGRRSWEFPTMADVQSDSKIDRRGRREYYGTFLPGSHSATVNIHIKIDRSSAQLTLIDSASQTDRCDLHFNVPSTSTTVNRADMALAVVQPTPLDHCPQLGEVNCEPGIPFSMFFKKESESSVSPKVDDLDISKLNIEKVSTGTSN